MNKARHYIRTLLTMLLLLGGMANGAWAQPYKVTYHVITLPFGGIGTFLETSTDKQSYRIEAIKTTVTYNNVTDIIELPAQFKSPLMTDDAYTYWTDVEKSGLIKIFPDNGSTFYTYSVDGKTAFYNPGETKKTVSNLTATATPVSGVYHIYVTYDWSDHKSLYGDSIKINGERKYNIEFSSGGKSWLYALNMNTDRGNRGQAIPAEDINDWADLCSKGIVEIKKENAPYGTEKKVKYHFTWKLVNNDPYNIILQTGYEDDSFVYQEEGYKKNSVGAQFYGRVNNKTVVETSTWLTNEVNRTYKSTTSVEYDNRNGWFRGGGDSYKVGSNGVSAHLYFSFSLLNRTTTPGDYTLVASWVDVNGDDWIPGTENSNKGQYIHMGRKNTKYPGPTFSTFANADRIRFHEIRDYVYKVKTPLTGQTLKAPLTWSDYKKTSLLKDCVPESLRRKYTSITGTYTTGELNTERTTFEDLYINDEPLKVKTRDIWLKYSASMPFDALPVGGSYTNATWYTIRLNGDKETQYLGYLKDNNFYTGGGKNDDLHYGENNANAQFAFIGDPYELKIISRGGSESNSGNRYVGTTTAAENNTTLTLTEGSPDISTWEIVYETTQPGNMILREFGKAGEATPKYIGWGYGEDNNPMRYSTSYSRIRVVELSTKKYRYHIVRNDAGDIAAMAIVDQEYGVKLEYSSIPEIIRSPFLALDGVEITFYSDLANAKTKTNPIANGSNDAVEYEDIYVRYDMGTALDNPPGDYITGGTTFNVRLNGQYIYYDSTTGNIKSSSSIVDSDSDGKTDDEVKYQWILGGSDPYAMTIKSVGSGKYVTIAGVTIADSDWENGTVSWSTDPTDPYSKFILKAGTYERAYEVMAATGDGVDASKTYYNFGRTGDTPVKMYKNVGVYMHGYDALRFYLEPLNAVTVAYHLIDRKGKDLLQVEGRHATTDKPHFPDEYQSPLVPDGGYHYWLETNFDKVEDFFGGGDPKYSLKTPKPSEVATIDVNRVIYVTYDIGDEYDMINKKDMFLLKFESGTPFRAEDGSDGMESAPITPVYPYCNGDCNFFVYGQAQFDLQQQGAASTRTRWAWFLESDDNDPYHVKICSRQTDTYNGDEVRAYFSTYQPSGYNEIVTNLVWPSISGLKGSEYMILGTDGHYRLMTTETVPLDANGDKIIESNARVTVKSFEQYWKTYDTVKNKLLKDILEESDKGAKPSGSITVPSTPASYRALLTGTGEGEYGFHSYNHWAYAKRFNGYNAAGKTSKGWEEVEHWFQTVDMNEGYFDLIPIEINPVLILLDQHGWEIMRKPLPNSPEDETKWAKYDEIRPYDSPMVESYYFWTKASKRSGFHQYYNLSQQITVDGKAYTSTSLTSLPPYDSPNVKDAKGNLLDQYVTYTVKDEYVKSVSVSYTTESARDADSNDYTRITAVTGTGVPFLIQQGSNFAYVADADATVDTKTVPTPGGMSQYIINNIAQLWPDAEKKNELWYLMPNFDIDNEMGYGDPAVASGINWVNDYRDKAKVKASGFNSWAFDPYNIQVSSVPYNAKYFVTNATAAELDNGSIIGTYGDAATVELGNQKSIPGDWHDSRKLAITNATFMAVQDADGHMQLMPRFDQTKRMKDFSTLVSPKAADIDQTYTQLFHPFVYNYIIVDNQGRESLRYKSGGDLVPQTPDHFKSPLAKDYTYYKDLTATAGVYNLKDIGSKEITASLVGADLKTEKVSNENQVYVRYKYDADADVLKVLQGKWLTMQLNKKDVQYTTVGETAGIYADADTPTKPASVDQDAKTWQWKFLESPQSDPDPYAVQLFNRSNTGKTALPADDTRFALLSHSDGDYALAQAELGTSENYDYTYKFLNGSSMSTTTAATIATEADFTCFAGTFRETGSQVKLTDEVLHSYTYKVYTHSGVEAVRAEQAYSEASFNEFVPVLPSEIQTPLLGIDKFRYYENLTDTAYSSGHPLTHLYGLYDDVVYVRYNAYDPKATNYLVPNVKGTEGGHVAKGEGSNDTPLRIDGKLPYNIVWYDDNMMKTYGSTINYTPGHGLDADDAYKWYLEGDDPYAIKIKNKAGKYVYSSDDNSCSLADGASTFMLLPRSGYDYGVLQKTATSKMLSGYGNTLVENTEPKHFIIFAMATYDVIYHLVIANIGKTKDIQFKKSGGSLTTKTISGSTQRDLVTKTSGVEGDKYQLGETVNGQTYCKKVGPISLGDSLRLPEVLKRPNCKYFYYVEGIYNNMDCEESHAISELNNKYKGLQAKYMGEDEALIHTYVRINVEYQFDDGLPTNSGSNFVSGVDQNRWYTFETVRKEGEDEIPWLAQFTNAWGCELKKGRGTHYTNDYLWSPIGDPYGFIMYNRYIYLNSGDNNTGEVNRVMTTDAFSEGQKIIMSKNKNPTDTEKANSVYELLTEEETTSGYFLVHPVVNNEGTKYYLGIVSGDDDSDGITNDYLKLSTTAQELTFGLSEELVKPYYDRAGYVGGLTSKGKAAYEEADSDLIAKQEVVYNLKNIVEFNNGYYRLHSPSDIDGVTERYASGYNHKIEETGVPGSPVHTGAVPMHFYERKGVNTTYEVLGSGFTFSEATRGALPVSAPEYDPASIINFAQVPTTISATENTNSNMAILTTQGLYVKCPVAKGGDEEGKKTNAIMTSTETDATSLYVMDIGGAIMLIHDNHVADSRAKLKYLSYDQTDADHIYDLKLTHNTNTDHAKWLMEPANEQGLKVTTNSGGDGYYYATFCAPFDVLLKGADDVAYISKKWETNIIHLKKIGKYNTGTYAGNNKFIPAGTTVIIRTPTVGDVSMSLPPGTVTEKISEYIFSGKYLEQKLDITTGTVYTFGLPYVSKMELESEETGEITSTLNQKGVTGVGFYINANPNKELGLARDSWNRNNHYVLHNKIYYLDSGSGSSRQGRIEDNKEFIPVVFDDNDEEDEPISERLRQRPADNRVYDLQGRCVSSGEAVRNGSWRNMVAPGVYIVNGKKVKL